jgi:alpha-tubulin suppressor-like RCC1 family protein
MAGVYITSFTDRGYSAGCGTSASDPNYFEVDAVDSDGNLWSIPYSSNYLPGDAEKLFTSNVIEVKGNGTRATARTSTGEIYYSYIAGCAYGNVVRPGGATLVDVAPYGSDGNMIAMTDTAKNVWTNSISQSAGVFQPGTWTKLSAIDSVRLSSTDTPKLFSDAPNYIGFASSRIFAPNYFSYDNGVCGSDSESRLYSTGQFGNVYFQDNVTVSSPTAYIGSGSALNFTSGQTLAAQSGDNLIFKLSNPQSSCFTGSTQLSATADLDGNGSYETNLSPTNESGTYAFIATTNAPNSGRKTYSFKIETPIGTSKIFTINVGVYASAPNVNVTARTKAFNTSYNTSFAVGTDGFGYAWGGGMNFMSILTSTPPRTQLKPTKITIPGNPQIIDGATYSNYDYGDDFGLLVVDAAGKVWSWGTRRNMDAPISTFAVGSVPTTPTQVSALSGVVIKRISTGGGSRALALSDAGNVYQWDSSNRTPTLVSGLAGITIKNIWASGDLYAALSTSGALYTWNGYGYSLGRIIASSDCYWCRDNNVGQATISDPVVDVSAGFSRNSDVMTALTSTGKLLSWGNFKASQVFIPEESTLPGGRTPLAIGSSGSWLYIVATDKTWWRQALDVNRNIVYYSVTNIPTDVRNTFSGFSNGTASGVITTNSNLYTLFSENAGTCGNVGAAARVMSEGQFGSTFADDSIDIEILGSEISRPNTDNYFNVIASSRCFGSTGVTVTADLTGGGTYSNALSSVAADDGSSLTARFKFNPSTNGALYIAVKATTSASVVSTQSYYTLVVPLPPAGRKIGVSINAGARYTNSSNVVLDLVWPDGVYKIYVSNDGGFAPGTVTEVDLQTQINWVLPPQAVIPLASIVYARFGDENNYYFDDIIIDSIAPVLTFASAK